jgi:hypothetical protein
LFYLCYSSVRVFGGGETVWVRVCVCLCCCFLRLPVGSGTDAISTYTFLFFSFGCLPVVHLLGHCSVVVAPCEKALGSDATVVLCAGGPRVIHSLLAVPARSIQHRAIRVSPLSRAAVSLVEEFCSLHCDDA